MNLFHPEDDKEKGRKFYEKMQKYAWSCYLNFSEEKKLRKKIPRSLYRSMSKNLN